MIGWRSSLVTFPIVTIGYGNGVGAPMMLYGATTAHQWCRAEQKVRVWFRYSRKGRECRR